MKFSACLLPNDAAELLEALLPMLRQLEELKTDEERIEGLATVRAWLVETSTALRRQDARGRPPAPPQGAQGTPSTKGPEMARSLTGQPAKKPCGCPERKTTVVQERPAETLGQGVARLLLARLGWGRKETTQ